MSIPNVDTIAQFSVQTAKVHRGKWPQSAASRHHDRMGTNAWHGTLWHFHRNSAVDIPRNTFALCRSQLIRNQFGYSLGGPVLKNRLFHFTSYRGRLSAERVYNSPTIRAEMLAGDFGARRITDPLANNAQFPQQQNSRLAVFKRVSRCFFPYTLLPNSGVDRFRALAPVSNDGSNFTFWDRLDYNPSEAHEYLQADGAGLAMTQVGVHAGSRTKSKPGTTECRADLRLDDQ